jgi:hypothetical protein
VVVGQLIIDQVFISDFWSNCLATLTGVVIGIPIAIWLSKTQEKATENERKAKILRLLYEELRVDLYILEGRIGKTVDKSLEVYIIGDKLRTESWQAFSDGGELQWVKDPFLLSNLAKAYYSIGYIQNLSRKYFETFLMPKGDVWSSQTFSTLAAFLLTELEKGIFGSEGKIKRVSAEIEAWRDRLGDQ